MGGHICFPNSVFHTPIPLHEVFPLFMMPFPPSPPEKSRLCFHGLLHVNHTSPTLMPLRICCPFLWPHLGTESLSALAWKRPGLQSQTTNGPRPGSATSGCKTPEKVAKCPQPQFPHLGKVTLHAEPATRTPVSNI